MILDKTTRDNVKIGTLLKSGDNTIWEVVNIYDVLSPYKKAVGKRMSLKWISAGDNNLIGRVIYGEKLSDYYGCEILNNESEDN